MTIPWTKTWSASDDGTILGGNDLGVLQSDIESATLQLTGSQTVTGNKTFSGTNTFSGSNTFSDTIVIGSTDLTDELPYLSGITTQVLSSGEAVCYEGDVACYEDDIVYYI